MENPWMQPRARETDRYTYADYQSWPDGERWELINGEAFAMTPAPTPTHQTIEVELLGQLVAYFRDKPCRVFPAPFDVRLPRGDEADEAIDTVVQPDIAVVCDAAKIDRRGCRGAPDWVIEILSPSTAGHDQVRKLALYERHGVKELWLVHPDDRVVMAFRLESGRYGRPEIAETLGTTSPALFPDLGIDWALVFAKVPIE
jgi:Uma2 family endonuclease